MLKFFKIFTVVLVICSVVTFPPVTYSVSIEARFVAGANANFSQALYEILKDESEFGVVSPLSLTIGLLALAAGAHGHTVKSLKTGLRVGHVEKQTLDSGLADIIYAIKDRAGQSVQFKSSIIILVPPTITFTPEYSSVLRSTFNNASIFPNTPSVTELLRRIGWVNGKFGFAQNSNLTAQPPFTQNENYNGAGGVLLSSTEFVGLWKKKFGFLSTRPGHFFKNQNDRLTVDMMRSDDYFPYARLPLLDASAVMLPFQGDRFGFIIILPNSRLGLPYVEANLKRQPLHLIPRRLKRTWVDLWLPKFNLTSTFFLAQSGALGRLRLASILYPSANFGRISCGDDLYFTDVTHRTTILVNEEGLGGLKPSVPRVEKLMTKRNQTTFNVDHAFLFFIYEYSTQSVLIVGRKQFN